VVLLEQTSLSTKIPASPKVRKKRGTRTGNNAGPIKNKKKR
jgi:hypothetical protein